MNAPLHLPAQQTEIRKALARNRLFADVSPPLLNELAQATTLSHLRKGQPVWQIGRQPIHLYLIDSGLIKRTALASNGNERILELLTEGDCLGISELMARRPYATSAEAGASSRLLCIDATAIRRTIRTEPLIGQHISELLATRQLAMEEETALSQSRSSTERVLDFLLRQLPAPLASSGETLLRLPASKHLIASRIGITPETLSRALRVLADAGLIVIRSNLILLQNGPLGMRLRSLEPKAINTTTASRTTANEAHEPMPLYSIINIAGRQRMLTQRMAKFWLMLGCGMAPARARRNLMLSIELFENQQRQLDELLITGPLNALRPHLGKLWQHYRHALESATDPTQADALFDLNEAVLHVTDEQTRAYVQARSTPSAELVNLAGRQRMLAQRIAKFHLFQHYGTRVSESRSGIETALNEFSAMLDRLMYALPEPDIAAGLTQVQAHWQTLQKLAKPTRNAKTHDAGHRVASICDLSEQLVRDMNNVVYLYEKRAAAA